MTKRPRPLAASSKRYRAVITGVTAVTLAILLLGHFGAYLVRPFDGEQVIVSCILLAPQLCYLYGLWSLRPAFEELAQNNLFGAQLSRSLATLGTSLVVGALVQIFLVANLIRLVRETPGSFLNFDPSAIVLAVVGGALVLLSRVLLKARKMKAELDEIL
jgi:hypothetical protein